MSFEWYFAATPACGRSVKCPNARAPHRVHSVLRDYDGLGLPRCCRSSSRLCRLTVSDCACARRGGTYIKNGLPHELHAATHFLMQMTFLFLPPFKIEVNNGDGGTDDEDKARLVTVLHEIRPVLAEHHAGVENRRRPRK